MKVLFDTNVILDVLLDRAPFSGPAAFLLALVEKEEISGCICATTVTTLHYLSSRILGESGVRSNLRNLTGLFEIASVNRSVIQDALDSEFGDFEDAVLYHAACHAGAEVIVTRDEKGFEKSALPVYTPLELLTFLKTVPY
jgi:predicted nucleic acid-binding protein